MTPLVAELAEPRVVEMPPLRHLYPRWSPEGAASYCGHHPHSCERDGIPYPRPDVRVCQACLAVWEGLRG